MNTAKLKSIMVLHGDTNLTLAEAISVSPQTVSAKINGKATFDQDEIAKIKKRYDLTPDEVDEIFLN